MPQFPPRPRFGKEPSSARHTRILGRRSNCPYRYYWLSVKSQYNLVVGWSYSLPQVGTVLRGTHTCQHNTIPCRDTAGTKDTAVLVVCLLGKRISIAPRYHREIVRRSYSRGYCSGRKSNSKHRLQTRQSKHLAVRGVQIFLETRGRVPYADPDMAPRRAATRRTGCWPAFFFLLPFFLCFSFSAGF